MKTFKLLSIAMLFLGASFVSSCKKEGCTDPDATNYSASANKNDGSCLYEGQALLWYGQTTSTGLQNDGATTLTYHVNGQIVGSSATSIFWTSSPECGQDASITITKDLGGAKNKSYSYSVRDQTGFEYWSGILNFTANSCDAVELVW